MLRTTSSYSIVFSLSFLAMLLFLACSPSSEQAKSDVFEEKNLEEQESEQALGEDAPLLLFFGNSLTAGYGLEAEESFPGLVEARLEELDIPFRVVNAGLSGETTASGLTRLDWFLEEEPAIFVLELGANDGLRGIALAETEKNLRSMIQLVQKRYPETAILLAGMQIPPNMGTQYAEDFRQLFPRIAADEGVTLIPFLLEGVAGDPDLNLPDGIHPTAEGHEIVFQTVWPFIAPLVGA
ncbi:MAG: arylesterase [Nitritalea sp.]